MSTIDDTIRRRCRNGSPTPTITIEPALAGGAPTAEERSAAIDAAVRGQAARRLQALLDRITPPTEPSDQEEPTP